MNSQSNNKKAITAWCLYDWATSAFPVIVTTFVFATYFTQHIANNKIIGTSQWAHALALSGILMAILCPILGVLVDISGKRKYWLGVNTAGIVISAGLFWFAYPSSSYTYFALSCLVIGTLSYNICLVFYNAMLLTLVKPGFMGRVSGIGWGLGYFGGLSILTIAYFSFVHSNFSWLNKILFEQIRICGPLVAIWIVIFSTPLFFYVPDDLKSKKANLSLSHSIQKFILTIKIIWHKKNILIFLIAQMSYADGLNTILAFAGIYAAGTFQLSIDTILLLGITVNVIAGLGSIILAPLTDRFGAKRTILLSLLGLTLFGLGIILVKTIIQFWVIACLWSIFVGPVQSASRAFMAELTPSEHAASLFGFYVMSGKMTMFVGPLLLGFMTVQFHSQRVGMGSILIFFVIGGTLLLFSGKDHAIKLKDTM